MGSTEVSSKVVIDLSVVVSAENGFWEESEGSLRIVPVKNSSRVRQAIRQIQRMSSNNREYGRIVRDQYAEN
jgi:predicted ATPase